MRSLCLLLAGFVSWALIGCSSGGSSDTPPAVTIAVAGGASSARLGGPAVQFTATMTGGSATSFAWAVNGTAGGSAALGTIDATGRYTPPAPGAVALQDPTTVAITASASGVTSPPATLSLLNPIPAVDARTPSSALAGSGALTLSVTGSGFVPGATVLWGGGARTTTFVGTTELQAAIGADDLASAATVEVSVRNPAPGGATSNATTFSVENPQPVVSSTSPASVVAGSGAFTLTVDGTGFVAGSPGSPGSVIRWDGTALQTTYVSATRLTAPVAAEAVAAVGSAEVTVVNAAPGGGTSSPLAFAVTAPAPTVGVVARVSVEPGGAQANDHSTDAAISATGRFVAFYSRASDLAPGDTNHQYDIYLRDTCVGAPAGCTPDTILVSANLAGSSSDQENMLGAVSADGRYVVFSSYARDLTADAIPGTSVTNIFLRDTCLGAAGPCTPSTRLVTRGVDEPSANSTCSAPALTPDARWVAFSCAATNIVANDTNDTGDVFLHDTCIGAAEGCAPSTQLVSLTATGAQGNGFSAYPLSLSETGRFVAFTSQATNLAGPDTNGGSDVYLRDTCIGAQGACTPTTIRVSVAADGAEPNNWSGFNGNGGGEHLPGVSASGRYVAFTTTASNIVPGDTNNSQDVFLRDTCLGAAGCTPTTTLVSAASGGGVGNGSSQHASLSADGRLVSFRSQAGNLIAGGNPTDGQAFVRDTCSGVASGCTPSTRIVSLKADGTPSNPGGGWMTVISADGRYVAFRSPANLVPGDTYWDDIYLAATGF